MADHAAGRDQNGQRCYRAMFGERFMHVGHRHRPTRGCCGAVDLTDLDPEPPHDAVKGFEVLLTHFLCGATHSSRSTTVDSSTPESTYSSPFLRCRFHSSAAFSASPALIMSSTIAWVLAARW